MVTLICPQGTAAYLEDVFESLLYGTLELHELPAPVAGIYYLGETSANEVIRQLTADADRYYRAACRGSFSPDLQRPGYTFAELCRIRGDFALADRVEADFRGLTFSLGGAL
jgi:hypothetical protein